MTAGRFYPSKNGKLKRTFAEILEELRFQYRLGFYPPDDEGTDVHQLRVRIERPNVVVRARPGYRTQAR
jgi:Ca-activated chloride channel family protein